MPEKMLRKLRQPLTIQLAPPKSLEDPAFQQLLRALSQYGFYGVELNLTDFDTLPPKALAKLLERHNLKMTMLATGVFAKQNGLSLSDPDPIVRGKTIDACEKMIRYAAPLGCGMILGFIKGKPCENRETARRFALDSLRRIAKTAQQENVKLLLEATNRYEASIANSLEDAVQMIEAVGSPSLYLLPDTYHMQIEESGMLPALIRYRQYFYSLHISDNNRLFPGLGRIDFRTLLHTLDAMGYDGYIGIEGNVRETLEQDLAVSVALLQYIQLTLN